MENYIRQLRTDLNITEICIYVQCVDIAISTQLYTCYVFVYLYTGCMIVIEGLIRFFKLFVLTDNLKNNICTAHTAPQ